MRGALNGAREEDTAGKVERGTVVVGTVATAGLAGALGAGLLGTVALPAALGYAGDKEIEAVHAQNRVRNETLDITVDTKTHSNLQMEERGLQKQLDAAGVSRDLKTFDVRRHGSDPYDLSNAENVAKISKVLKEHEVVEQQLIVDNTSNLPMVTESLRQEWSRKTSAEGELKRTQVAEIELAQQYLKVHPEAASAAKEATKPVNGSLDPYHVMDLHPSNIQTPLSSSVNKQQIQNQKQ